MSEPRVDYRRIYAAVPLFRELSEDELNAILTVSRLFRVDGETVLVRQGESLPGTYVLIDGTARVLVASEEAGETRLATLQRGDVVGELNLIDTAPHSATVVCNDRCTLFHIDPEGFNQLRAEWHLAAFKVLRAIAPTICQRLRRINERIASIFAHPERSMAEIEQGYLAHAEDDPWH